MHHYHNSQYTVKPLNMYIKQVAVRVYAPLTQLTVHCQTIKHVRQTGGCTRLCTITTTHSTLSNH